MKVFSYCGEGLQQPDLTGDITLEQLVHIIKNHPQKELIAALRMLPYKSERYTNIKKMLPYIMPHATFKGRRRKENIEKLSGYIYYDVDMSSLPNGKEVMKKQILQRHGDKIVLLGTSVGGRGLFFYVRLANPEVLTKENFATIYNYIRCVLFSDISTDANAGGIVRTHIVPWDSEVYVHLNASVRVPESVLRGKKLISRGINNTTPLCCTPTDKFLDIKAVLKIIKNTTEVEVVSRRAKSRWRRQSKARRRSASPSSR